MTKTIPYYLRLTVFLVSLSATLLAQPNRSFQFKDCPLVANLDSLEQVKNGQKPSSEAYLRTLLSLERTYTQGNYDQVGQYLPLIKTLSVKLNSTTGMAMWYYLNAHSLLKNSQLIEASSACDKALHLFARQKDTLGLAHCYGTKVGLHISAVGEERGSLKEAKEYILKIQNLSLKTADNEVKLVELGTLLIYYYAKPDKNINNIKNIVNAANNLINYNKKYTNLYLKLNNMLANAYHFEKDYEKSLLIRQRCLTTIKPSQTFELTLTNYNIANDYRQLGLFKKAQVYYLKALKASNARTKKTLLLKRSIYENYGELLKETGKLKEAFMARDSFDLYNNKLQTIEQRSEFKALEIKYNFQKKEQENKFLLIEKQAAERQNQFYVRVIILGLILLAIIIGLSIFSVTTNRKLRQLAQFRNQVFSIIAHDLRSPLTAFEGLSQQVTYLLRKGQYARMLTISQSMDESIARMSLLLNNLLEWSLTQKPGLIYSTETITLRTLLHEVTDLYQIIAQNRQVAIETIIPAELTLRGDENSLSVVFRNLIDNALKHTTNGIIRIEALTAGNRVEIKVSDTGTGIPLKEAVLLQKLFDRTSAITVDRKIGLGLSMVQHIVGLHQGKVNFQTDERGTTFIVSFPK